MFDVASVWWTGTEWNRWGATDAQEYLYALHYHYTTQVGLFGT